MSKQLIYVDDKTDRELNQLAKELDIPKYKAIEYVFKEFFKIRSEAKK